MVMDKVQKEAYFELMDMLKNKDNHSEGKVLCCEAYYKKLDNVRFFIWIKYKEPTSNGHTKYTADILEISEFSINLKRDEILTDIDVNVLEKMNHYECIMIINAFKIATSYNLEDRKDGGYCTND